MAAKTFQFHQTLHGYDDGHRLLATSCKLPPDAERLMLILSDMSGANMARGFENYLTGYPLKEINSYALARTWYAPEMRRPGCVWTHTFLVSNADLAHINPVALQNLFIRPKINLTEWDEYIHPFLFDDKRLENLSAHIDEGVIKRHLTRSVVNALYNFPRDQIFLSQEKTSSGIENLVLAIWAQQWAQLRRSFWFCTGAIDDRQSVGINFDLQVIPIAKTDNIRRKSPKAVFVEAEKLINISLDIKRPLWLETAVDDLYKSYSAGLRSFLRTFGAEKRRRRSDFKPLAEIYAFGELVRQKAKYVSEFTEFIAQLYPIPDQEKFLKRTFYTANNQNNGKINRFSLSTDDSAMLEELIQSEYNSAFDANDLQIADRAAALTQSDFDASSKIAHYILTTPSTLFGEEFLDGFCQNLTANKISEFPAEVLNLVLPIIKRNPTLITSRALWKADRKTQQELFYYARHHLNIDDNLVDQIVTAMLEAGSDLIANEIAYYYPQTVINRVLQWCDSLPIEEALNIGRDWMLILSKEEQRSLEWLKNNYSGNISTLILLALLIDPHSYEVQQSGTRIWLELANNADKIIDNDIYISVMSFLLALGFNNPDDDAVQLVTKAFEPIHEAAEEDQLSERNWNMLARQTPSVTWNGDWNKCERLRGALIKRFMRYEWSREEFLACLRNPVLLEKIIAQVWEQDSWFGSQRKYIEKIARKVFNSKISATTIQKDVLHKMLD